MSQLADDRTAGVAKQLQAARSELDSLKGRISVRLALKVAAKTAAVARVVRWLRNPNPRVRPAHTTRPPVVHAIRAARPDRGPRSGPLVSIVVPTRDGAHHLGRLLNGLERVTSYRDFELIVVDNASQDHTADVLAQSWTFPVRTLRNDRNVSFSAACNQGAEVASGELLLFLNNDIEPITSGWLGSLVQTVQDGYEASGALLVYSEKIPGAYLRRHPDFTVQHRGIAFGWRDRTPTGYNLGAGEDPTDRSLVGTKEVPAVSAACLLVTRSAYERVHGFSENYIYGWEDVDFCMKLRWTGGRVAVNLDAALFHYEFGTQEDWAGTPRRIHYLNNHRQFSEVWGPFLHRVMRRESLGDETFWNVKGHRTVAITVTRDDPDAGYGDWYTAHELGAALQAEGFEVNYLERYADRWYDLDPSTSVVINLLADYDLDQVPHGPLLVAWVRNWPERWIENPSFGKYDLALVSTREFGDRLDGATAVPTALMPLATNPQRFRPGPPEATFEADYTFPGSVWGRSREIINRIEVEPDERFTIFGLGWEREPRAQRYWRGAIPYGSLPALYRSARIVLDDTVEPNRPAVNSRVFDALASGTLVISDNPEGSSEWFDGLLPTATTRQELRQTLDRFLADSELRDATTAQLREIVLTRHTYAHRAPAIVHHLHEALATPKLRVKIGPPDRSVAHKWGDTHFALDLARAIRRHGWRTAIDILPDWDDPSTQDADVVVHVRGLVPYVPKPGAINVLWIISHPTEIEPAECERYDIVFVASHRYAEQLSDKVSVPVYPLLQATDRDRFAAGVARPEFESDLLFVGNSRNVFRHGVRWALEQDLPLTLWGSGWKQFIGHHAALRGENFPNKDLPDLFASTKIVLNDHWPDMAELGFISNRVFDAAAAGAFVLTDRVADLDAVFDLALPTYSTAEELAELTHHYLGDAESRIAAARKLHSAVLADHTFENRASTMIKHVEPLISERVNIADNGSREQAT